MSEASPPKTDAPNTVSEPAATLSSYFTSQPVADDIFDSVFEQHVTESVSPSIPALPSHKPELTEDATTLNALRQRDAWLPSESTRRMLLALKSTATPPVGEIKPVLSKLEVELSALSLTDPYRDVLRSHVKDEGKVSSIRPIPDSIDRVPQSIEGLKELVANGWYRAALHLTRRLLTSWGYGEGAVLTPWSAQVWLTRLALLVRVRSFDLAEIELASFQTLDTPNVYFEHAPELYPGRYGSIIPFSLRLLHAELPFHCGRIEDALDRLYYLLAIIDRMRCNLQKGFTEDGSVLPPATGYTEASLSLWACREVRVLSSCLSIYLAESDYEAAIETIHRMALTCSADRAVLRGLSGILGRVYLQLGDLETSKAYFNRSMPTMDSKRQLPMSAQQLFQQALLSVGRGEYDEAKKLFQQTLAVDPTNVAAINNMAVCSLYLGHLSEAMNVLDSLTANGLAEHRIRPMEHHQPVITGADPLNSASSRTVSRFPLHDSLVSNLAVLYEAESDESTAKKVKLLERFSSSSGEPVNVANFKLATA